MEKQRELGRTQALLAESNDMRSWVASIPHDSPYRVEAETYILSIKADADGARQHTATLLAEMQVESAFSGVRTTSALRGKTTVRLAKQQNAMRKKQLQDSQRRSEEAQEQIQLLADRTTDTSEVTVEIMDENANAATERLHAAIEAQEELQAVVDADDGDIDDTEEVDEILESIRARNNAAAAAALERVTSPDVILDIPPVPPVTVNRRQQQQRTVVLA